MAMTAWIPAEKLQPAVCMIDLLCSYLGMLRGTLCHCVERQTRQGHCPFKTRQIIMLPFCNTPFPDLALVPNFSCFPRF